MVRTDYLIAGTIVVYLVALAVFFGPVTGPRGPGEPGTAHAHLYFAVSIDGERIDFSREQYQLADRRVHFENRDGEILHVHAERVTVGYILESLGIEINGTCLAAGRTVCSNSTHELRVYVDGDVIEDPVTYVPAQDDNVMVWYGPAEEEPDGSFFRRRLPDRYRPGRQGEPV